MVWLRSALNEKETELLETREQHQRLLVRPPGQQCCGRCPRAQRVSGSRQALRVQHAYSSLCIRWGVCCLLGQASTGAHQ